MPFGSILVKAGAPVLWSHSGLNTMYRSTFSESRIFLPADVLSSCLPEFNPGALKYTYCGLGHYMARDLYDQRKWVIHLVGERLWYVIKDQYITVFHRDPDEADTPLGRLLSRYPDLARKTNAQARKAQHRHNSGGDSGPSPGIPGTPGIHPHRREDQRPAYGRGLHRH